jgi:predicted PurR-regulated permease PerM
MAMSPLRRKVVLLVVAGAGLVALLYAFRSVLVPFVLALTLAYVLSPVVNAMTRLGGARRPLPRWIAVVVLYTGLLTGLVFFSVGFLPRLADELGVMMKEVPAAFRHVREEWLPALAEAYEENLSPLLQRRDPDVVTQAQPRDAEPVVERAAAIVLRPIPREGAYRLELQDLAIDVQRTASDTVVLTARSPEKPSARASPDLEQSLTDAIGGLLAKGQEHASVLFNVGQEVVVFLIRFTFTFFITLMLSAFILADQKRILEFFESLVPRAYREDYRGALAAIDRGLAGVVRGQLLICLVNGTLSGIGFAIADLKYWPVLTAIATVFTLVPIFGTIISSIPAVLIGLTQSWGTGVFVLAWITGIHQLEANILNPKIIGSMARIHPVVVFFALLAGERAAGLLGVLLGVPVASILQNVFLFWKNRLYADEQGDGPAAPPPPAGGSDPGPPTAASRDGPASA